MDQLFISPEFLLLVSLAWSLPWKGFGLWKAARLNHKVWFTAMLIINTFGLLEIVYIFIFSKYNIDLNWLKNKLGISKSKPTKK